jgi:hypothetical protein
MAGRPGRAAPAGPFRQVSRARLKAGRGSYLGPATSRRARWWELALECGHQAERPARYRPLGDKDRQDEAWRRKRSAADVLPAPKRARCPECRYVGDFS